jgi:hypothetical protein
VRVFNRNQPRRRKLLKETPRRPSYCGWSMAGCGGAGAGDPAPSILHPTNDYVEQPSFACGISTRERHNQPRSQFQLGRPLLVGLGP